MPSDCKNNHTHVSNRYKELGIQSVSRFISSMGRPLFSME